MLASLTATIGIAEHAVGLHRAQPDDAGGRLLGAGQHLGQHAPGGAVHASNHVAAVVHRQVRTRARWRRSMCCNRCRCPRRAWRRRRSRIRRPARRRRRPGSTAGWRRTAAPRPRRPERAHQVGGLGGDMQAGGDAQAGQRPFGREALADGGQHRHLAVGPLDPALPRRQREVAHVMRNGCGHPAMIASRARAGATPAASRAVP